MAAVSVIISKEKEEHVLCDECGEECVVVHSGFEEVGYCPFCGALLKGAKKASQSFESDTDESFDFAVEDED